MKTIKSLKDITTLEVGDVVVFGGLKYEVAHNNTYLNDYYYLDNFNGVNDVIFKKLNINKRNLVERLGINANFVCDFPETKSLEALTAMVSALFKEYKKQNELPKTWEEFCKRNPIKKEEHWIECFDGDILMAAGTRIEGKRRDPEMDKNMCTSKQDAEAHLALMQLRQLRKVYVKDWEPNWNCPSAKFCILVGRNKIQVADSYYCQETLSFPTEKLAKQFLTNFKDLLEIAKPLL